MIDTHEGFYLLLWGRGNEHGINRIVETGSLGGMSVRSRRPLVESRDAPIGGASESIFVSVRVCLCKEAGWRELAFGFDVNIDTLWKLLFRSEAYVVAQKALAPFRLRPPASSTGAIGGPSFILANKSYVCSVLPSWSRSVSPPNLPLDPAAREPTKLQSVRERCVSVSGKTLPP